MAVVRDSQYSPIPFPEEGQHQGKYADVRCSLLPVRCGGDGYTVELSWQWSGKPANTAPLSSDLVELRWVGCDELSHLLDLPLNPGNIYCLVDYCRADGTLAETVAVALQPVEHHNMVRAEIPLCRITQKDGTLWPRSGRIVLDTGSRSEEEIFLMGYDFAYRHSIHPMVHHRVDMDDSAWMGWGSGIETMAEDSLWIDRQGRLNE